MVQALEKAAEQEDKAVNITAEKLKMEVRDYTEQEEKPEEQTKIDMAAVAAEVMEMVETAERTALQEKTEHMAAAVEAAVKTRKAVKAATVLLLSDGALRLGVVNNDLCSYVKKCCFGYC